MDFPPKRARLWLSILPLLVFALALFLSRQSTLENASQSPLAETVAPSLEVPSRDAVDGCAEFERWRARFAGGQASFAEGIRLAGVRRAQLFELIKSDPQAALAASVPYADRKRLPPEIVNLLETPVSTAADLDVWQACGGPGQTSSLTRWVALDGEQHQVFTFGDRREAMSKNRLSVQGIAIDGRLALSDDPIRILSNAETVDRGFRGLAFQVGARIYQIDSERHLAEIRKALLESEQTLGPDALPAYRKLVLGEIEGVDFIAMQDGGTTGADDTPPDAESAFTEGAKTMLYIRARFADEDPAYEPVTLTNAQNRQGESEAFWFENSYGKSSLSTTFTDVVTLPKNGSDYVGNFATLRNDAAAAAVALNTNWDRDDYDFYTIVTNSQSNPSFGYAGVAQLNNKGSHLLRQYISVRTASHEYGHNLGLNHSAYWLTDSSSPIGEDSKPGGYVGDAADDERIEYGHKFAVMGAQNGSGDFDSGRAHFTAGNKNRLDWLVQGDGDVVLTTTSGTYQLYRHDVKQADFASMTGGVPRAIKINVDATDPTGFSAPYKYWLNYRLLPTNGIAENWLPHGIQVDWRRDGSGFRSVQLDMTPYSRDSGPYGANPGTNSDNSDKEDGVLVIGRTFSDVSADIHFTATGKGGTNPNEYLDVVVNVGTQGTNAPPVIQTLTASATQVNTGEAVTFTVSATDPDGDTLAYYWDNDDDSIQPAQLNQATQTKGWGSAGFYVVRAEVSDMKGGKTVQSVLVQVGNPTNAGQIHGRVVQSGQPVEGAFVRAGSVETWTESDGTYVLAGLPLGTQTVTVDKPSLTFTPQFANPVQVTSLNVFGADFFANEPLADTAPLRLVVSPFEIELPFGASFSFEATGWDASGAGVATSPTWSVDGGGTIDSNGTFTSTTVGGPFTVTATDGSVTATARVTAISALAVGVVAFDSEAAEPGGNDGVFRIQRYGSTSGALTVPFSLSGTATLDADFSDPGGSVVIPDGDAFVDLTIAVLDDFESEPSETVTLTITPDAAYGIFGSESAATLHILDDGDVAPVASILRPTTDFVAIPSGVGLELVGSGTDDGLPQALTGHWTVNSAPPGATVRFSPPVGLETMAWFSADGVYDLGCVVSDGVNVATASQRVAVGADGVTQPAPTDLIVSLSFEDGSGTTAADDAGGDNEGTLVSGAAFTAEGGGVTGRGIALDGVNDVVTLANVSEINTSAQGLRTISLWFKADDPSGSSAQVLYEEGGQSRGFCIYLQSNRLYFGGWNNNENGWNETHFSTPLADTEWHHATLILDADGVTAAVADALRGYLDGKLIGSGEGAIMNAHSANIGIGAMRGDTRLHTGNESGNGNYFAGLIDECRLWNRALSELEVAQLAAVLDPAPGFGLAGIADRWRAVVLPTGARLLLDGSASWTGGWMQWSGPAGGVASFDEGSLPGNAVSMTVPGFYGLRLGASTPRLATGIDLAVFAGIDAPQVPSPSGREIHYAFEEGTGTTAMDSVGGNDDGMLANGPVWGSGVSGGGVTLDGVDDMVEINNRSPINTSSSHTQKSIAIWFLPDATGTGAKEVLYEQGGSTRGLNLYLEGDVLWAGGWNAGINGWATTYLSAPIQRGQWHHAVLTLDVPGGANVVADGLRLHLNGILVAAGEAAEMSSHTGNVAIGAHRSDTKFHDGNGSGDGAYFMGSLDEFHYLNDRTLTQDEIGGLYAAHNIAALVEAGPDQPEPQSLTLTIAGSITDDGGAGSVTPAWSIHEGPAGGTATFDQPDANGIPTRVVLSTDGVYRLRLAAFDGQATTIDDMPVSASDGPTFGGWLGGHFELTGDDLLPTANTDNDPFNQFYEYATGGNPTADDDPRILGPVSEVTDDTGDDYFELTYRRRRDYLARNLIYEVEFSETMAPDTWDTVMGTIVGVTPVNAEIERVTVRFSDAIGGDNTRQFARLSIREGP